MTHVLLISRIKPPNGNKHVLMMSFTLNLYTEYFVQLLRVLVQGLQKYVKRICSTEYANIRYVFNLNLTT